MKIFMWLVLVIFSAGLFISAYCLPSLKPWQDNLSVVAAIGFMISVIGLAFAIFPNPKRIGPDGKVYYYNRGFFTYTHPDGKVDFWPGDGKGDGDKKE